MKYYVILMLKMLESVKYVLLKWCKTSEEKKKNKVIKVFVKIDLNSFCQNYRSIWLHHFESASGYAKS